jgi:uroporphyrinogen-III decarboxylase
MTAATSAERLRLMLQGQRLAGHFMMPLVKQFCTVNTGAQYGRYSQDYRVLTACQLEIMERYPIDIFNCLGYPYREAGDCGLPVEFPQDAQPTSHGVLVHTREDLATLDWPDPHQGPLMSDRIRAIAEFKRLRPDIVAMGACEAPFALACTFLGIERAMLLLCEDADFLLDVMRWIEPHSQRFVAAQIEAGADMIFMGDSLASQVGRRFYADYILESERRMIHAVQAAGVPVRLHICGNITGILELVAGAGARFIDVDYPVDLTKACRVAADLSPGSYVVGNFDPVEVLLRGKPDDVRQACRRCEREAAGLDNFILAPGCEVPPATPVENYQAMLEFGWKARAKVQR